ncbi:MAG: T9SS type A sorting domain-containing protein [Flavobacteriales bacterium]|nr:T9SS type A sorting domain-containing protein [Flavobacteriales bacterium]
MATKTYEVEVRVSKDLGATWCVDAPVPACDPNPVTTWGKVCNVTITSANVDGGASSMTTTGNGGLTMYPNPNRGDQLVIALNTVAQDVRTVSVDIYNLTGQRVTARTISCTGWFLEHDHRSER